MFDKIREILKSIRFWEITVAVILFALVEAGTIDSETSVLVAKVIATILGISVTVNTIDRFAEKIALRK